MTTKPFRGLRRRTLVLAAALGCAAPSPLQRSDRAQPAPAPPLPAVEASRRDRVEIVLASARATLGQAEPLLDGRRIPTDCSGYLHALYARAGIDLLSEGRPSDNGVRAIVRFVERHGVLHRQKLPAPGDLVFFDNSYDRNGDGRMNDRFTHAGLVEAVLHDGTVVVIHATNHGIVREPMNLLHPHDLADADGRPINAFLRRKTPGDRPHTPRLMSELFAGFGRVLPLDRAVSAHAPASRASPSGRASRRIARSR